MGACRRAGRYRGAAGDGFWRLRGLLPLSRPPGRRVLGGCEGCSHCRVPPGDGFWRLRGLLPLSRPPGRHFLAVARAAPTFASPRETVFGGCEGCSHFRAPPGDGFWRLRGLLPLSRPPGRQFLAVARAAPTFASPQETVFGGCEGCSHCRVPPGDSFWRLRGLLPLSRPPRRRFLAVARAAPTFASPLAVGSPPPPPTPCEIPLPPAVPQKYFFDAFNIVDFILVLITIFAFISLFAPPLEFVGNLRGLRALRLLKFFELVPLGLRARTMNRAWLSCMPRYFLLECIHFMFIWVFAVIGCELLKDVVVPPTVRTTYANLLDGIITTYTLSTGEGPPLPPPVEQSMGRETRWRLRGGRVWHKASVFGCLPLAAPIGLSPLLILTLPGGGVGRRGALPAVPGVGGGGRPPTSTAQNDPHVALIILTTRVWEGGFWPKASVSDCLP